VLTGGYRPDNAAFGAAGEGVSYKAAILSAFVLSIGILAGARATEPPARKRPAPLYRVDRELTLSGRVKSVVIRAARGELPGEHLTLATAQGTVDVQLGPPRSRVVEDYELRAGDEVQVTGSLINYRGGSVMLARQLKRGAQVMTVRSKRGYPVASRGGRGRAAAFRAQ
jgi:hypothetical protein